MRGRISGPHTPGARAFLSSRQWPQHRPKVGIRQPITDSVFVRVYYLLQSVNLPAGWDTNQIFGISLSFKIVSKKK
jgi:hypothetical protein